MALQTVDVAPATAQASTASHSLLGHALKDAFITGLIALGPARPADRLPHRGARQRHRQRARPRLPAARTRRYGRHHLRRPAAAEPHRLVAQSRLKPKSGPGALGRAALAAGPALKPALLAFAIAFPVIAAYMSGSLNQARYLIDLGILILTYVMLGWGLNIVVGLAGLLDLGYVAFYAVGALHLRAARHLGPITTSSPASSAKPSGPIGRSGSACRWPACSPGCGG
jgi:branched-chain amino acid transport system permease protein